MTLRLLLIALLLLPALNDVASLKVKKPADDSVVSTANITIVGTSSGASVTVRNGVQSASTPVINNEWTLTGVPLDLGLNTLTLSDGDGNPETLFITRASTIVARPQQKVRLVWEEGSDDILREIAKGTIDDTIADATLDQFVKDIKTLTAQIFSSAYQGVADIRLVADDGDDVHTVRFLALDEDAYGLTLPDCGNSDLHGHTRVFLGTYQRLMVGHLEDWPPMSSKDSLVVRLRDVAEALGRTTAHEVGHGVGLVTDNRESPCNWMNGCNGNHTCSIFQILHPGIHRFAQGAFIMDAGDESANHARVAEPNEDGRAQDRVPSVFCDFDRSYLAAIHPPGGRP